MFSIIEIEISISKLDDILLKDTLNYWNLSTSGEKDELLERYKKKVIDVGFLKFLKKIKIKEREEILKYLNIEYRKNWKEELYKIGIFNLMETVNESILKKFCHIVGLECSEKQSMIEQLIDEIILNGMELFLSQLSVILLKNHCSQLSLLTSGSKDDLVERLMVSIFELEPLE